VASTPLTVEQVLTLLEELPQRIAALTTGLSPAQLRARPDDDSWSSVDVLAHLRSCADVWGDCITTILTDDHPKIRAIDPRTWGKQTNYHDLEFQPSFRDFTTQRAALLATLTPLTTEQWSRTATMTHSGKPIDRTAQSFAARLARHERTHVKQIQRIVAGMQA
jgi:hypothetical protein